MSTGDSCAHIIKLAGENEHSNRRYICLGDKNNKTSSTHLFGFVNAVYPEGPKNYPVEFWKVNLILDYYFFSILLSG